MPSFTNTLEQTIHQAISLANERRHEFATLEHLLLAMLDEPDASQVMRACGVDLAALYERLTSFVNDDLSTLVTEVEGSEAVPTAGFQRVIQRAAIHVQSAGRTEVTGANVLVAFFAERESNAAYFLQEENMTRYDAVNYITHGVAKDPAFQDLLTADHDDEGDVPVDEEEDAQPPVLVKKIIYQRVLDNMDSVNFFTKFMRTMVQSEIDRLSETRPNSPAAEKFKCEQIELLELFALAFDKIADALDHLNERPENERSAHMATAVQSGWAPIGKFLSEHAEGWLSAGVNLGLVGCGVGFFSMLGLPPSSSITPAAAVVTAPMLLKFAGQLNINLNRKDERPDDPPPDQR